ncbi:MAG TPA: tetratricopeptide repeat protein, partial [Acidobacteriota bacterium]
SILQFDAMRRISDYSYLPFALRLLNTTQKRVAGAGRLRLIHLAGSTLFWMGRPDKAEYFLRQLVQSETISRETDTALSAHVFLATIEADRQDFSAAYETIHKALRLAQQTGNVYQELRIRNEWAGILLDNQRVEEARAMLTELLPCAEALGDFYLVALVLVGLGDAAVKQQEWEVAETYLQDAISLFSSLGLAHGKAKALLLKGVAAFYRQQYIRAMDLYGGAIEIFEKGGEMVEACHGYYNLSEVCMMLGKKTEAEDWYKKGIHSFRAKDNPQLAKLYEELRSMLSK